MKVTALGSGLVGLVTGACIAPGRMTFARSLKRGRAAGGDLARVTGAGTPGRSDVAVTTTEWKVLRATDFHALATRLADKAVLDGHNICELAEFGDAGPSRLPNGRRQVN